MRSVLRKNAVIPEKYRKLPPPCFLILGEEGETIHDIDTVKHYTSEKIFRQPFYAMFLKKRKKIRQKPYRNFFAKIKQLFSIVPSMIFSADFPENKQKIQIAPIFRKRRESCTGNCAELSCEKRRDRPFPRVSKDLRRTPLHSREILLSRPCNGRAIDSGRQAQAHRLQRFLRFYEELCACRRSRNA